MKDLFNAPTIFFSLLFLLATALMFTSNYIYYNVHVGVNPCGSYCDKSWLSPIDGFLPKSLRATGMCPDVCVETKIPHPSNEPLLILGVYLLVVSFLLLFIYLIRSFLRSR